MEWLNIIITFISVIISGSIISIFTIREQRKAAMLSNKEKEADIKEKEDNRWEKIADQLQDQVENLNERLDKKDARIMELEDSNASLRQKLDEANTAAVKAALLRCNRLACERRSPPLGYAELTPEEMLIERKRLAAEKIEDE